MTDRSFAKGTYWFLVAATIGGASAAAGDDPFADAWILYEEGANAQTGYTSPETALGPPERFTGKCFQFPGVVSAFNPAFCPDEIVSIGAGGTLVLRFDTPVTNDEANPFGIDLLIFGNTFFEDASYPQGIVNGVFGPEGGIVEVSPDGVDWFEVEGIDADGEFLDGDRVRAGAGVDTFPDLIEATVSRGLGGLHHFVGIPSSVGGALWQNLHFLSPAPERERTVFIAEVLETASILTQEGQLRTVDVAYFEFGYDYSVLHVRDDIVLEAVFQLTVQPEEELRRVMEENLEWRSGRHPDLSRYPCAGSIFKKVEGVGAGRLIDECGLKGHRHGNAEIFEGHANIIINLGGATAADVRHLIDLARSTVATELGYELVPEIAFVGDF